MISLQKRLEAFEKLGTQLNELVFNFQNNENQDKTALFASKIRSASTKNGWFTEQNIISAIQGITSWLQKDALNQWVSTYPHLQENTSAKRVVVIMAGNIPLVNFHDFISVIISGNIFIGKLSSQDDVLLPYIAELLVEIEPELKNNIQFTSEIIKNIDAIIATGSDNSARYFEYYFQKYPHIIRKNRSSIAVLTGNETTEELKALGNDVFQYFGLGCRNISYLFLPQRFDFKRMLDAWDDFQSVAHLSKYVNNYDYQKAILLLNKVPFYDNGFLLVKESEQLATPVSTLHYSFYNNIEEVNEYIAQNNAKIQCIVSTDKTIKNALDCGKTQMPTLSDYPDGVDILDFLIKLN